MSAVGIKLIVEVLDHAPGDLTAGELVVLLVLAEYANDVTRQAWPGMDLLTRRARMQPDTIGKALRRLSGRGLEVRTPIAWTKAGKPVFAHHGRQTSYWIPPLRRSADSPTIEDTKPGPQADLQAGEGLPSVRGRSAQRPSMVCPTADPSPHEPSAKPSSAAPRGRAEALVTIRTFIDDDDVPGRLFSFEPDRDEIAEVVLDLILERKPRSVVAYVNKIANDGGMPDWIDRAWSVIEEREAAQLQKLRAEFIQARKQEPYCEHGYPGGHVTDVRGWMSCPIERKAAGGDDPWEF